MRPKPAVLSVVPLPAARKRPREDLAPLQAGLLAALPAAERVLAIGSGAEALARGHCLRHGFAAWTLLSWSDPSLSAVAADADLIVIADGFAGAGDPLGALRAIAAACNGATQLFATLANEAQMSELIRLVEGDLSEAGAPAPCRAFASPPSAYKLLMDAGWMPHFVAQTPVATGDRGNAGTDALASATSALADALDLPRATVERRLAISGLVVQASRCFEHLPAARGADTARFSVVVPTTRARQLRLNVERSPGLLELGVPVLPIAGAASPADALASALPLIDTDWVLLCHQDVYFPAGFATRLHAVLDAIPEAEHAAALIGFAGMAVSADKRGHVPAGFVIDRLQRFDHGASTTALSIDELAIVVSRHSLHRIDPAMGWHLWATDLCLTAICEHKVFPRIVRLPLFHNSVNDYTLSAAFHASAAKLATKFPTFGAIPTLCATIDAPFLARHAPATAVPAASAAPAAARKTEPPPPASPSVGPHVVAPEANLCCLCGEAVSQWVPHPHIGQRSEFMKLLGAVGSDLAVYQCPACGSNDRERHLWLYMRARQLPQRFASMRILHVAPEPNLAAIIEQLAPRAYVRGDLHPQNASHVALDVEALLFADASFELVLCNHVLEHVANPERALAEFHRVLAPGGTLIAQTPYAPALRQTLELNRPVSAAFASLFYGQDDHVRLFGADIADRIRAAGFAGDLVPHTELLGALDAHAHGVNGREPFFCFTR